jgi:hypothetical protein
MFRLPGEYEENKADIALRLGLRGLPVPDTSSDFDARVHAALRPPPPVRQMLWTYARPVLSAAACSLLITLALLKGLAATSAVQERLSQPVGIGAMVAYGTRQRMDALDSSDPSAASLSGFATLSVRSR